MLATVHLSSERPKFLFAREVRRKVVRCGALRFPAFRRHCARSLAIAAAALRISRTPVRETSAHSGVVLGIFSTTQIEDPRNCEAIVCQHPSFRWAARFTLDTAL